MENTARFGKKAMVAVFTHEHNLAQNPKPGLYTDEGMEPHQYEGNPVIEPVDVH